MATMKRLSDAASMSLDGYLHQLAAENPALIEGGNRDQFADLARRNAPTLIDLQVWRFKVGFFWHNLKPGGDSRRLGGVVDFPRKQRAAPGDLVADVTRQRARVLQSIGPDFMLDGRRLAEWTANDLRKVGGVFAVLLEMVPTRKRNRPLGEVLTAEQWQQAAKARP